MAEITQKLGFEATGAITTINNLTAALNKLNTALGAFNKRTGEQNQSKIITGFAQVSSGAEKASKSVETVGKKLQEAGQRGKKAATEMTISWGGLVKALVARTAVQAITATIGALRNATDAAAEFQITVARIANIAQGQAGTIDALTESLGNLSVSLGRDIGEVSEAAFEALQNDLGTTEDTMRLLEGAAHDLALVTGGTLTQSVNSISSVIKAFGIDITEADAIADTFFQAIDSGRITLEEFQSSLGRVAPIAGVLGVTFEETAAAIATITQAGTTARVAQTQLRNVLQKMLDPTKSLTAAFQQLGFATGKELIAATGGLIPALQQVATVAEVGSQEFADFFGTIRGNLGSLNLLNNEGDNFNKIFAEMANKAGRAAESAEAIEGVDARDAARSVEELNKTLRELGGDLLKVKNVALATFNGLISSGTDAKIAITVLAGTVTALAVAGGAAAIAFAPLTVSILAIGAIVGSVALGVKKLSDAFANSKSQAEVAAEALKEFEEAQKKVASDRAAEEFKRQMQEQTDSVKEFTQEASKDYQKLANDVKASQENVQSAIDNSIGNFAKKIKDLVKDIGKSLDGLKDTAKEFRDEAADIGKEIENAAFEKNLKTLTKQQQINARNLALEKARKEVVEAASKIDTTPESKEAFNKAKDNARELQKNLDEASKGNAFNARQAADQALKTQKLLQNQNKKAADNLDAQIAEGQSERTRQAIRDAEAVAEKVEDLEGVTPGSEEAQKLRGEIDKAIDEVDTAALGDKAGAAFQEAVSTFQQDLDTLTVQFENAAQNLQAALDAHGPFRAAVDFGDQLGATGNQGLDQRLADIDENVQDPGERARQKLQANQEFLATQNEAIAKEKDLAQEVANATEELSKRGVELAKVSQAAVLSSGEAAREALQNIIDIKKELDAAPTETEGSSAQVNELKAQLETSKELTSVQKEAALSTLTALDGVIAKQQQLNDLRAGEGETSPDTEAAAQASQNIEQALKGAAEAEFGNVEQLSESAKQADTATKGIALSATEAFNSLGQLVPISQNIGTNMQTTATGAAETATATGNISSGMTNVVTQTNAATAAMNALAAAARAAAAAARAAAAAAASAGGSRYHGGKVNYRAQGGVTRGQDNILTSTSPGEMVVNARSSRQFFSELQAINAGQSAQTRDKGGSVTTIGDINVNLPPGGTVDPFTANTIASEIRRSLRRNTSRLL